MTKNVLEKREDFPKFFRSKKHLQNPLPHYYCVVVVIVVVARFERAFIGAFLLSPLRREENGEVSGDDEDTTE